VTFVTEAKKHEVKRLYNKQLTSYAVGYMARVNEGSHSFTCHPHVHPQME